MASPRAAPLFFMLISGLLLLYGVLTISSGDLWLPFKHGWTNLSGASGVTFMIAMALWLTGSIVLYAKNFTDRRVTIGLSCFALGSLLLVIMHWVPGAVSCQEKAMTKCTAG